MADQALYLRVAVPAPLRQTFQYLPPAGYDAAELVPGARVRVPFGNKMTTALLLGVDETTDLVPSRLRRAERVLDRVPVLGPQLLALCEWAADYYHHPLGEVVAAALPALLRRGVPVEAERRVLSVTATGRAIDGAKLGRAPRQRAILDLLRGAGHPVDDSEARQLGIVGRPLNELIAKGLVERRTADAQNAPPPAPPTWRSSSGGEPLRAEPLRLNEEQQQALHALVSAPAGAARCFLLEGVTGSGKTEVYLQAIARSLRDGGQALVLVPEISLTPQTVNRFRDRFTVPVEVLHSGLTDRERLDGWRRAATGESAIVIGTRSAIFTPLRDPALIIVDEEHDHSFKQHEGFRYSARDLAVMRGYMEKIPVILGSATPSLETLHNARIGRYDRLKLTRRAGGAAPPRYRLLDIRNQPLDEGFSRPLIQLIGEHLLRDNQVLVFINRRGFAPTLLCHRCGWIAHCSRCDARMTLHMLSASMQCHHCGARHPIPAACPQCGGAELARLGAGTERTEAALRRLFPDQRVIRIDRDTVRRRNAMAAMIEEIERGEPAILVGTQMLAKGHHFPHLTLVAVLDADAGFFSSDFRAVETTGQLLLQVTGRTGRWEKEGEAVIQTHFAEHPLLVNLTRRGYGSFAEELLAERRAADLPPFAYIVLVRAEATRQELPLEFLAAAAEVQREVLLGDGEEEVAILGPIPSAMEKRAGRYRAQLLLQAQQRRPLQRLLATALPRIEELPLARRVRWSVDVDPLDTI